MVKACLKKVLRFRISNVVLKRKLSAQSSKTRASSKRCPKFISIDDSIENEWKTLKSKSGYTTDKLFLNYLLRLAAKDLYGISSSSSSNDNITYLPKGDKSSVYYENSSNSNWNKCISQNVEKEKKIVEHKFEKEKTFMKGKRNFKNPGTQDVSVKTLRQHNFCENEVNKKNSSENEGILSKGISSQCKKNKREGSSDTRKTTLNEFYDNISSGQNNSDSSLEEKQRESLFSEIQMSEDDKCLKNLKRKRKHERYQTLVGKEKVTIKSKKCRKLKKQRKKKGESNDSKSNLVSRVRHSEPFVFDDDFNKDCLKSEQKLLSDVENSIYNLDNCVFNSNNSKESLTQREKRLSPNDSHLYLDKRYRTNKIVLVTNNSSADGSSKIYVKSFATSTLPSYLYFKTVHNEHGLSVFSKTLISKSTQLGPLLGQRIKEKDISDDVNMKDIWEINLKDGISYLSTEDAETSNWLRFIRPAENRATANLVVIVKEENLYFQTIRDINNGDELVYWIDDCHPAWSKKKLDKKNCGGCNLQFAHILYYRKHCMIFHDPNSSLTTKKFHCKICGLAVLGKEKIMKHASEFHQGKGAYQCQYCHKFFLRLNYLETHRTYGCAKNPRRSRPLCDLCGRKFCQPQKLKIHMKRMHSDISQVLRDFQCKNCQKILGCRAALQRHLKEVHNKDVVGAFTCDRCGKIFQNKSNLKIHMLTHSGIKPFKCQEVECNAAFTTKQCLQFHYKKIHGFTDDVIPKIERSVAFTFDAYSGGVFSDLEQDSYFALQQSTLRKNNSGLDLTLAPSSNQASNGKPNAFKNLLSRETNLMEQLDDRYVSGKDFTEKTSSSEELNKINCEIMSGDNDLSSGGETDSIVINKSNKNFWESDSTLVKTDITTKEFLKGNLSRNSPLMEPIMSTSEKDIFEKPIEGEKSSCNERLDRNDLDISSLDECVNSSNIESSDKEMEPCDLPLLDSSKLNCLREKDNKKDNDRSSFSDIFKFNNLLRSSSSPITETSGDCNVNITVREDGDESPSEVDITSNRSRDFIDTCKGSEVFYETHRNQDEMSRGDKMDSFRGNEFDFRFLSSDKFDCRDFDFSSEYKNIVNNMEKARNEGEFHRGRGESYDLQIDYGRVMGTDRESEAQNLCLKKPYNCESIEELAKIGRDNAGFETVFSSEALNSNLNPNFGVPLLRSSHGMVSPRPYHQTPFESESVDLTVPRPAFSTSPVYSLDLTPSRLDLSARHLDFRGHLGLSTIRLGNSSSPVVSSDSSAHMSPTGYGTYQSSYGMSGSRTSQTSQFQPYTPLYY